MAQLKFQPYGNQDEQNLSTALENLLNEESNNAILTTIANKYFPGEDLTPVPNHKLGMAVYMLASFKGAMPAGEVDDPQNTCGTLIDVWKKAADKKEAKESLDPLSDVDFKGLTGVIKKINNVCDQQKNNSYLKTAITGYIESRKFTFGREIE